MIDIAALKADPSMSFWLKESIDKLQDRDVLDAVADAKLLYAVAQQLYTEATGRVYGATKTPGVPMANTRDLDRLMGW